MTLMDRYILGKYLRALFICVVSFTGMFVVADAFNNLDEFIRYGRDESGGVLAVVLQYYRPRALTFLNMAGGLMALMAAMFTVTSLQRSRETTALMAGGVPAMRIVTPMIAAAVAVSLLGVVNREMWIPRYRDQLARNAQNWKGENSRPVEPSFDHVTQIYLDGSQTLWAERRIDKPTFRLPQSLRHVGRKVQGEFAYQTPATADRPAGFRVTGVSEPEGLTGRASIALGERPVILTPADTDWLKADECFVVSEVSFEQLANRESWRQYASSAELIEALHNPSLEYGAGVRVALHARFVQPILDVLLVMIGLPLVMTRRSQNVFASVGKCLLLVIGFWILVMGAHQAGAAYLVRPVLAAWLPVMVLAPISVVMIHGLWE